jgi:esterase/lipase
MYHKAEDAYNKLIKEGKPVDRVVGHSLGGAMALQLQKDKDIPLSRTFGAPVLDIGINH